MQPFDQIRLYLFRRPVPVEVAHSIHTSLSRQSLYRDSHGVKQVNYLTEMCSCPANQLRPRAAAGKGDASLREGARGGGNRDILTRDNGGVMDMFRKAPEITARWRLAFCCLLCLTQPAH